MQLVEGRTYRFKQLCDLKCLGNWNPYGKMDYLAETEVVARCVKSNEFTVSKKYDSGTWVITPSMLEEVCDDKNYHVLVLSPSSKITKYETEENALAAIATMIEGGNKGTYRMYQMYQEVETPKLDISSMIRKVIDKILPKDE